MSGVSVRPGAQGAAVSSGEGCSCGDAKEQTTAEREQPGRPLGCTAFRSKHPPIQMFNHIIVIFSVHL